MSNYDLFSTGQVLGYPIEFSVVMKHLQQDMRDDWFADTLGYSDVYSNHEYAMRVILECLNKWGGVYRGDKRVLRAIPKKEFAERYSLETDFFDRFVYQSICTFLIPHLDPLLSHRVLSYRHNRNSSEKKYLFRNKISKWLDYEGLTYTFYQDGKYLAATDVSNFFENVSCEQIIASLDSIADSVECDGYQKGQIRASIRVLKSLLNNWSYSGDFGLPQNRDASSFLSNVLLCEVDSKMRERGYDYYRYVDDIRIVCDTQTDARAALQLVIGLLRDVGMNINAAKTSIVSNASSDSALTELFPSKNPLVTAIASMWRSRSRRVFVRSVEYIVEIIQSSIDSESTQSRSFRFAVNRLSQLIDAGLFDVKGACAIELQEYAYKGLTSDAVSTDQLCRLIQVLDPSDTDLARVASFLIDRNNCLHDWQNYHLWILLASRKFDSEGLRSTAIDVITLDPTKGESSAIFIWLHAVSYITPIENLVDTYSDEWPYQNQRYFLMAASGCSKDIKEKLRASVTEKLYGTMVKASKKFRSDGVAISDREKPTLSDLFEDIKDYS